MKYFGGGSGGGGSGVTSFNTRTGAVVPTNGDYNSSQITNSSGVSGSDVTSALNTLNATIDLTGSRVVNGPAGTFLAGGSPNSWQTLFTAPANPGDTGKTVIASAGNFTYLGGSSTGQMLNWNGSSWVAGVDFGALNPVTTTGFLANSSTGFIRLGLASGSGSSVASAASSGNIRGARGTNGFQLFVRNDGDTADIAVLATDTVGSALNISNTTAGSLSTIIAAPSAGSITFRVGSSSTQVQLTTAAISTLIPIFSFFSSVTSPIIQQQSTSTNSAVGHKLVINAQDCTGTTATGGAFDIRPGSGTSAGGLLRLMSGGGAISSTQRFALDDTGIALYGGSTVAQASRVGQLTNNTGVGAPGTTVNDVGGAFNQSTLNTNFAAILLKVNAIETAIHNIGLTA